MHWKAEVHPVELLAVFRCFSTYCVPNIASLVRGLRARWDVGEVSCASGGTYSCGVMPSHQPLALHSCTLTAQGSI